MNRTTPVSTLKVIRLALLAGVVIFGFAIAYLSRTGALQPDPDVAGVLRLAFLPLALGSVVGMMAVRSAQSRAEPDRKGALAIIGWALGEGVALFGGVAWLVAGEMMLYLTGLGLMIVALLLVPVPADS